MGQVREVHEYHIEALRAQYLVEYLLQHRRREQMALEAASGQPRARLEGAAPPPAYAVLIAHEGHIPAVLTHGRPAGPGGLIVVMENDGREVMVLAKVAKQAMSTGLRPEPRW